MCKRVGLMCFCCHREVCTKHNGLFSATEAVLGVFERGEGMMCVFQTVRLPEDAVPKRWVPPFIGQDLRRHEAQDRSPSALLPSSSSEGKRQASSFPAYLPVSSRMSSSQDLVGLGEAVRRGDSTVFRIRTGWVGLNQQNTGNKPAVSQRVGSMGSRWPWIEGGNIPRHGRLRLQLRASMIQAPQGGDYWSGPVSLDALGGAAIVQVRKWDVFTPVSKHADSSFK